MPEARIDGTVAAFTLAVSLFIGLIFGLAPVAVALRAELNDGLRSMKRIHLPSLLVTAEVALSLVLLAAAGLLMQSFLRMRGMATGIQSDQVSVLWLILNPHHYEKFPARSAFYDETLRRVRQQNATLPVLLVTAYADIREAVGAMRDGALAARDRKIELELTDKATDYFAERGYDPMYGARPLKRLVQQELETGLARKILAGEVRDGSKVVVDAGPRGLTFEVKLPTAKAAA